MRQSGKWCGRSEAASSRGRNEAARGAAKVKRQAARQSGERCGELAAGRTVRRKANGAVQAKPRSGTGHAPLPRRPSERPILAALPPLAPAAALFPPHSPPPFPRRRASPSPPLSLPCRRARMGAAAGKKPNPPRRFPRRGGSRTALEGRGGSLGTAGFLWARGLAQAAAGRAGRQKGTKCPFFPAFGQKYAAKYCNFRPRVLY